MSGARACVQNDQMLGHKFRDNEILCNVNMSMTIRPMFLFLQSFDYGSEMKT